MLQHDERAVCLGNARRFALSALCGFTLACVLAGRGPGAALGVLAIAVVAVGTYVSHVVVERSQAQKVQS